MRMRLPADPFIPTAHLPVLGDPGEIHQELVLAYRLRNSRKPGIVPGYHHHLSLLDHLGDVLFQPAGDMWGFAVQILPVGAGEPGQLYRLIEYGHLETLAKECLDEDDAGTLPQIVGALLEGEAQNAHPGAAACLDETYALLQEIGRASCRERAETRV